MWPEYRIAGEGIGIGDLHAEIENPDFVTGEFHPGP